MSTTTKAIKKAIDAHKAASDAFDKLESALGVQPDFGFFNECWKAMEASLKAVSIAVGDKDDWISWFAYDNDYGREALKAGYGDNLKSIRNVKGLIWLIEEGKRE